MGVEAHLDRVEHVLGDDVLVVRLLAFFAPELELALDFAPREPIVVILYAAVLIMAFLHVAPFRTAKMARIGYYVFTAYVVMATGGYSYIMATQ